jgi:hypothetical protein
MPKAAPTLPPAPKTAARMLWLVATKLARMPSLFIFLAVAVAEGFLVRALVDRYHLSLTLIPLAILMVLLALVLLACFYRSPLGRRFAASRYLFKPVVCLRSSPEHDPAAVTAVLQRTLSAWRLNAKPASAPARATPTISTKDVSVPLDWLWDTFTRLVTGRKTIVIDSLLDDTGEKTRLLVSTATQSTVTQWLDYEIQKDHPFGQELAAVLEPLVIELIGSIEPEVRTGIDEAVGHYDTAIQICRQRPPSVDRDLDLAGLLINSGQEERACEQLDAVEADYVWLNWTQSGRLQHLRALALHASGNYDAATAVAQRFIDSRSWSPFESDRSLIRNLWLLRGDAARDQNRYDDAHKAYKTAEAGAIKRLRRVLHLPKAADLGACLRRAHIRFAGEVDEPLSVLETVFADRAILLRLEGKDPRFEYVRRREVLKALSGRAQRPSAWFASLRMSQAQVAKYHAQENAARGEIESDGPAFDGVEFADVDLIDAPPSFAQAITFYEEAMEAAQFASFRADQDYNLKRTLAWCEFGRLQCRRAKQDDPSLAELGPGVDLLRRLVGLITKEPPGVYATQWLSDYVPDDQNSGDGEAMLSEAATLLSQAALTAQNPPAGELLAELAAFAMPLRDAGQTATHSGEAAEKRAATDALSLLEHLLAKNDLNSIGMIESEINEGEATLNKCVNHANELINSKYHQKEFYYVGACLCSILSGGNDDNYITQAADYLRHVMGKMDSSNATIRRDEVFITRARIDPDFDLIRNNSKIEAILGPPPSHFRQPEPTIPHVA